MKRTETQQQLQLLHKCAIEEFCRVGYRNASLRKICENAGLTTGFLYSRYRNKQDLFNSIVRDVAADLEKMTRKFFVKYREDISPDSPIRKEQDVIRYLYSRKAVLNLLFRHAQGTEYEDFSKRIFELYLEEFIRFYNECIGPEDPIYLEVICNMRYQSYESILKQDLTLEESIDIARKTGTFKAEGLYGIIASLPERDSSASHN